MYEQSDLALIGSRIKAVRTSKGMSQADLAVKASVSLPLISNIERGKTRMQLETFVKVAEALQVSADHLLRADVPEVNVDGIFHCVRAALPGMLQKQQGAIVTVSSMWGQVGASCEAAYSATKGAVLALSKALAQELGPSHIRVNTICPGVIQTDMCANVAPEILESLREQTPIERLGTPEDIAQAMAFLVDAPFITGQVLGVNGGFVIT